MNNSDYVVSEEKDYILSCATLLGQSGFPKAAFIKMVGNEFASDIFDLINNGQLIMNATIITYPLRDKRKKRINSDAQMRFYHGMMSELTAFVSTYFDSINLPFTINESNSMNMRLPTPLDVDSNIDNPSVECSNKYHRNKGKYLCESLIRSVNKLPLSQTDVNNTFWLLGWYYTILGKTDEANVAFRRILR